MKRIQRRNLVTPALACSRAVALALLAVSPARSLAAPHPPDGCVAELIAESSSLPEAYSARGQYCDGTVAIKNGAELQIVSYTAGPVTFLTTQQELSVKSVVPTSGAVHLLGVDKRPSGSYRLDGNLPAGGLQVQLNPAVHPKKIDANALGLLAWTDADGERLLIPLRAGAGEEAAKTATLTFRTPTAVVQSVYELCEGGGPCGEQQSLGENLTAGSLLTVRLARANKPRTVAVKITVLAPGNRYFGQVVKVRVP